MLEKNYFEYLQKQLNKLKRNEEILIKSEKWNLGGTVGNCWDSHLSTISGEEPLKSFYNFDQLMYMINPNISFLDYKLIYEKFVEIKTESESDYYGGSVDYSYYEINLNELIDFLKDKNILKEERLIFLLETDFDCFV